MTEDLTQAPGATDPTTGKPADAVPPPQSPIPTMQTDDTAAPTAIPAVSSGVPGLGAEMAADAKDAKDALVAAAPQVPRGLAEAGAVLAHGAQAIAGAVQPIVGEAGAQALAKGAGTVARVAQESAASYAEPKTGFQHAVNDVTRFIGVQAATAPIAEAAETAAGLKEAPAMIGRLVASTRAALIQTAIDDPNRAHTIVGDIASAANTSLSTAASHALSVNHTDPTAVKYVKHFADNLASFVFLDSVMAMAGGVFAARNGLTAGRLVDSSEGGREDAAMAIEGPTGTRVVPTDATLARIAAIRERTLQESALRNRPEAPSAPLARPAEPPTGAFGEGTQVYRGAEGGNALPEAAVQPARPAPQGFEAGALPPAQRPLEPERGGMPAETPEEQARNAAQRAVMQHELNEVVQMPQGFEHLPPGLQPEFLHREVGFPNPADAQVEIAQRNAQVEQEEIRAAGGMRPNEVEGFQAMHEALAAGADHHVIDHLLDLHDVKVPQDLNPKQLDLYIGKLGFHLGNPFEGNLPQQARAAAALLEPGSKPEEVVRRFTERYGAGKDVPAKMLAAHVYLKQLGRQFNRISEAVLNAPKSYAAQENFRQAYQQFVGAHLGLHDVKLPLPGEETMAPAAIKDLAEAVRANDGNPEGIAEAVRLQQAEEQHVAAAAAIPTIKKVAKTLGMAVINNLIIGPVTLLKIGVSQTYMSLKAPAINTLGGFMRAAEGAAHMNSAEVRAGADMAIGGKDQAFEMLRSIPDGLRAGARAMRMAGSEIDPRANLFAAGKPSPDLLDLGHFNFLYNAQFFPGRLHASVTEVSKVMNYRANIYREAAAQARSTGGDISDIFKQRMDNAFDVNGKGISEGEAMYEAQKATFTLPLRDGTWGAKINETLTDAPVIRALVSPFVGISTNILREAWRSAPGLNRFQGEVREALAAGGEQAWRQRGNVALGSMIATWMMAQAMKGNLHGSPPTNPDLAHEFKQNGFVPYSIQMGDHSISLSRVEPLGIFGQTIADFADKSKSIMKHSMERQEFNARVGLNKHAYLDDHPVCQHLRQAADACDAIRGVDSDEGIHIINALATSITSAVANRSYVKSIGEFIEAVEDQDHYKLAKWVGDKASEVVAGNALVKALSTDPVQREPRSFIQRARADLQPGFSRTLEPKRNMLGEVMPNPQGFLNWMNGHINPFTVGKAGKDPIVNQLALLGKAMPFMGTTTKGKYGAEDVDWTDGHRWNQEGADENGVAQSPYGRVMQLMATPMFKGQSARENMTDLFRSDAFKRESGNLGDDNSRKFSRASMLMHEMLAHATKQMLDEPRFYNFARALKATQRSGRKSNEDAAEDVYQDIIRDSSSGDSAFAHSLTP